jgi:hypothetical protein
MNQIFKRKHDREYWLNIFRKMENHEIDTWDYQWTYDIFKHNDFCINPSENLITNIGFGNDATHTFNAETIYNNQLRYDITIIKHPDCIKINHHIINRINKVRFGTECWLKRKYKRNIQQCKKLFRFFKRILFGGNSVHG